MRLCDSKRQCTNAISLAGYKVAKDPTRREPTGHADARGKGRTHDEQEHLHRATGHPVVQLVE